MVGHRPVFVSKRSADATLVREGFEILKHKHDASVVVSTQWQTWRHKVSRLHDVMITTNREMSKTLLCRSATANLTRLTHTNTLLFTFKESFSNKTPTLYKTRRFWNLTIPVTFYSCSVCRINLALNQRRSHRGLISNQPIYMRYMPRGTVRRDIQPINRTSLTRWRKSTRF